MASDLDWPPFCPQNGAKHDTVCRDHVHCSNCGKKNPNYTGDGEPYQIDSTAFRASQQRAVRESTTPQYSESSQAPSSPLSGPFIRQPSQVRRNAAHTSYSGFQSLGPRQAEQARGIANRNIRKEEVRANASSVAVTARTKPPLLPPPPKPLSKHSISLTLEAHTITLTISRRGTQRTWSEPHKQGQWIDGFFEEDFDKELSQSTTHSTYLLDWLMNRCTDDWIKEQYLQDGVKAHFIVRFDADNNQPIRVTSKALAVDSLQGMLTPWSKKKEMVLMICFEKIIDKRPRERSPLFDEAFATVDTFPEETIETRPIEASPLPELSQLPIKPERLWKQRVCTRCHARDRLATYTDRLMIQTALSSTWTSRLHRKEPVSTLALTLFWPGYLMAYSLLLLLNHCLLYSQNLQ